MLDNNDQSYVLRFFLRELFYPERLLPFGELAHDNQDPGYDQHSCKNIFHGGLWDKKR